MAALAKQQQQQQQQPAVLAADVQRSSSLFSTAQLLSSGLTSPPAPDKPPLELSPTSPLADPADAIAMTSSDSNDGVLSAVRASSSRRAIDAAGRVSRGASPFGGGRGGDQTDPGLEHGFRTPPRGSSPDRADVRTRRPVLLPAPEGTAAVHTDARCALRTCARLRNPPIVVLSPAVSRACKRELPQGVLRLIRRRSNQSVASPSATSAFQNAFATASPGQGLDARLSRAASKDTAPPRSAATSLQDSFARAAGDRRQRGSSAEPREYGGVGDSPDAAKQARRRASPDARLGTRPRGLSPDGRRSAAEAGRIQNAFAAAPTASLSRSQTLAAETPESSSAGRVTAAGTEVRRDGAVAVRARDSGCARHLQHLVPLLQPSGVRLDHGWSSIAVMNSCEKVIHRNIRRNSDCAGPNITWVTWRSGACHLHPSARCPLRPASRTPPSYRPALRGLDAARGTGPPASSQPGKRVPWRTASRTRLRWRRRTACRLAGRRADAAGCPLRQQKVFTMLRKLLLGFQAV